MLRITQLHITQTVVKIFKLKSALGEYIPHSGIILWLKFKNTNSHKYAFNKFDILKISTLNKIEVQNIHHMELPRLHLLIDSWSNKWMPGILFNTLLMCLEVLLNRQ